MFPARNALTVIVDYPAPCVQDPPPTVGHSCPSGPRPQRHVRHSPRQGTRTNHATRSRNPLLREWNGMSPQDACLALSTT